MCVLLDRICTKGGEDVLPLVVAVAESKWTKDILVSDRIGFHHWPIAGVQKIRVRRPAVSNLQNMRAPLEASLFVQWLLLVR